MPRIAFLFCAFSVFAVNGLSRSWDRAFRDEAIASAARREPRSPELAKCRFDQDQPSGHAVIRAKAGPSEIVITTTPRLAGAIHSVAWNGKEFIDSTDHGRQLQSAANFDPRWGVWLASSVV